MTTLHQTTSQMMWNRLNGTRSGQAITMAAIGGASGARIVRAQDATPAASPFAAPVDVINYALTLEHIETVFYRVAVKKFGVSDFTDAGFQDSRCRAHLDDR